MEILQNQEHPAGGLSVQVYNGKRKLWYHLPEDARQDTAAMRSARLLVKGKKPKPLVEIEAEQEQARVKRIKARNKARIKDINDELKGLGARQIKSIEEIANAKAFITFERARIFRENDGA